MINNLLNEIDLAIMDSQEQTYVSLLNTYDKSISILEECQTLSDVNSFQIFQESSTEKDDNENKEKKQGVVDEVIEKHKNENILLRIIAFIPRVVIGVIKRIFSSNVKTDVNGAEFKQTTTEFYDKKIKELDVVNDASKILIGAGAGITAGLLVNDYRLWKKRERGTNKEWIKHCFNVSGNLKTALNGNKGKDSIKEITDIKNKTIDLFSEIPSLLLFAFNNDKQLCVIEKRSGFIKDSIDKLINNGINISQKMIDQLIKYVKGIKSPSSSLPETIYFESINEDLKKSNEELTNILSEYKDVVIGIINGETYDDVSYTPVNIIDASLGQLKEKARKRLKNFSNTNKSKIEDLVKGENFNKASDKAKNYYMEFCNKIMNTALGMLQIPCMFATKIISSYISQINERFTQMKKDLGKKEEDEKRKIEEIKKNIHKEDVN